MVKSTLTDYGTLLTSTSFEKVRGDAAATKINAYRKTTYKIPLFVERYISDAMYYQVPRGLCRIGYVTRNEPPQLKMDDTPSLMGYQDTIVSHITDRLVSDGHFYLQMDTGLGKSYVAAGLVTALKVKTCIIVANKSLSRQMAEDLTKAIPSVSVKAYKSGETIGTSIAMGKKVTYVPRESVVLVVINTAAKLPAEFFEHFGLVIYDEVHAYCTETFSAVFFKADSARYTFGMTATPTRLDGMESVSFLHLGNPVMAAEIAVGDDEMAAGNFFGSAIRVAYAGPPAFTKKVINSAGVPSPILMAKQFLEDPFRLILAASIIIDAYNAGRNIYIFCQTKDPLEVLRRRILRMVPDEYKDIISRELFIITGDSKEEMAAAARSTSRIFLTTYSLSAKGLSIVRFDTLILLTPMKSNMMQITGRIFRKKSDERRRRLIIDIVDDETFMAKQYSERVKTYHTRDLEMVTAAIAYDQVGSEKALRKVLSAIDAFKVYDPDRGDERENPIREDWPIIPISTVERYMAMYSKDEEDDEN